jgi:2-polyprenyl-3-methyl-5-hydroxy-6-metoxy-1,4-benzoquinol methylase
MSGQVEYYNDFGNKYADAILACPEPEFWTTDYGEKGRVYREMKERVLRQQDMINKNFSVQHPVLDIGCGFGRQAIMLAKKGYTVYGIDTSSVFISIANKLFEKEGLKGSFESIDIFSNRQIEGNFRQILLLDIIEHLKPVRRRKVFEKIYNIAETEATIIVSLPHVKKRVTSQFKNTIRRSITSRFSFFLNKEEHPYPVPQKKDMVKYAKGLFDLIEFAESPETDYYLFSKR